MIDYQKSKNLRAVGLLSGGLDSTLAAKVVHDLGVEVHGVYFAMPWGCCDKGQAQAAADRLGIPFMVLQLDHRYLEMIKNPKFGYGKVLNPCVDCRIHMFGRAGQYAKAIGAEFVFTGEVLGQRPMSQMRHSMRAIEKATGLEGRLLRPLCAHFMEETIPEKEGMIDRNQLLAISGRSRKEQIRLAEKWGIRDYPNPAGGCLLTDRSFARRMSDTLEHGYRSFRETVALQWGRHFRFSPTVKIILGRDEKENEALKHYAHPDDVIMELPDRKGPTLILKGPAVADDQLASAAGLVQYYSRHRAAAPVKVLYWKADQPGDVKDVIASVWTEKEIKEQVI